MNWFTSDTHLDHKNIIKYCNRPFSSIQEMNETIINNWNSVVSKEDTVYHLGDFAFGKVNEFANKLNGKIVLIKGNHDTIPHNHMFAEVCDTKIVTIDNHMIFMSHFAHRVWPRSHHNTWHLYGHSHNRIDSQGKSFDVGVDTNKYRLYSFEDIKSKMYDMPDNWDVGIKDGGKNNAIN